MNVLYQTEKPCNWKIQFVFPFIHILIRLFSMKKKKSYTKHEAYIRDKNLRNMVSPFQQFSCICIFYFVWMRMLSQRSEKNTESIKTNIHIVIENRTLDYQRIGKLVFECVHYVGDALILFFTYWSELFLKIYFTNSFWINASRYM